MNVARNAPTSQLLNIYTHPNRDATKSRRFCPTSAAAADALPPKTHRQAVSEARIALRNFRETLREAPDAANQSLIRTTMQLPLPYPSIEDDNIRAFDEGQWPGGIRQKFRALRPLVEGLLEGYSPQFLGMLESPADGIGVWTASGGSVTVAANVSSATFAPFARLCAGDFGSRVLDPGHLMIAVNPSWTTSADIGQFWQRDLKAQAAALIDDPKAWEALYYLKDVRTAKGATGLLLRSFPGSWRLYSTEVDEKEDTLGAEGAPLLESEEQPERAAMIQALNQTDFKKSKIKFF